MPVLIDLPQAVLNEVEIHRCAEKIYASGSANTAEISIRDGALLSLASFSEVTNDKKNFCSKREAKIKIKQLNKKIWRLTKESKEKAEFIKNLGKENSDQKKTLYKLQKDLEKRELDCKYCEELKSSIESEREKIEAKRIESEGLWNVVGKLGDVNVELKREAEKSLKRENHLKNEIKKVKLALSLRKYITAPDLYVSTRASDWSKKLDIDRLALSRRQAFIKRRTSKRRTSCTQAKKTFMEKYAGRQEKSMKGNGRPPENCPWPTPASSVELKEDVSSIADQIKRQDVLFDNDHKNLDDEGKGIPANGTNIWETFQKWNWQLDYPAKKENAMRLGEPNPSLVPLKIIDDRVQLLESTAACEVDSATSPLTIA